MGISRIGILTGGGDCPGLNPAIRAATKKLLSQSFEVIGLRDGWRGLVEENSKLTLPLNYDNVRHIDREGGTILGTSRTNPYKMANGVQKIQSRFETLGLTGLIAIGGEDTLGVASKLFAEINLPVVGIPKTIDRDLNGTEYTLGFESALQVITESIDTLRSTAESHSRIFVVEVMGRHAGHLALRGGISAGASIILIPESPFNIEKVCNLLMERKKRGIRYTIVVAAEGALPEGGLAQVQTGAKDAFGHVRLGGIGQILAEEIEKRTSLETRSVNLSHLQRGGRPVSFDRRLGFYLGTAAAEAIQMKQFGTMASLRKGRICLVNLNEAQGPLHTVNIDAFYDITRYKPKQEILGTLGPISEN